MALPILRATPTPIGFSTSYVTLLYYLARFSKLTAGLHLWRLPLGCPGPKMANRQNDRYRNGPLGNGPLDNARLSHLHGHHDQSLLPRLPRVGRRTFLYPLDRHGELTTLFARDRLTNEFSQWYTKAEQGFRMPLWYAGGIGVGLGTAGLINYGLVHINPTAFPKWETLFFFWGSL